MQLKSKISMYLYLNNDVLRAKNVKGREVATPHFGQSAFDQIAILYLIFFENSPTGVDLRFHVIIEHVIHHTCCNTYT